MTERDTEGNVDGCDVVAGNTDPTPDDDLPVPEPEQ